MKQCRKQSPICSSNSMGSSEIWDKYHGSCIEISIFNASRLSSIYPKIHSYSQVNTIPFLYVVSSVFRVVLLQDSQLLKLPKKLLLCTNTRQHYVIVALNFTVTVYPCTLFLASLPVHYHLVTSVAMQFVAVH